MIRTSRGKKSRKVLALFSIMALVVIAVGVPTLALQEQSRNWIPESVQNTAFDIWLDIAPTTKKISSILQGSLLDDRLFIEDIGEPVQIQGEELQLSGTLYRPTQQGPSPALLILHGSTPEGRKMGLYRFLGTELAKLGYIVLAIDLRGYGDSEDPARTDNAAAINPTGDVFTALDYLTSLPEADPERLFVIGHSAGAEPAMAAGISDARIKKIIAIGPPRRVKDRALSEGSLDSDYFWRRTMHYLDLRQPIPKDVFLELNQTMNMENYLAYFSTETHKPVLFIDGMLEGAEDRAYLQEYMNSIVPPKAYKTLPNADHYANTANFGPIVFFDQQVSQLLVTEIDTWISNN